LLEAHWPRGGMQVSHTGSWRGGPGQVGIGRRCAGLAPALKGLDDEHASPAAWAWRVGIIGFDWCGCGHGRGGGEQLAGAFELRLAGGTGEQAVMADAVEAFWHDV